MSCTCPKKEGPKEVPVDNSSALKLTTTGLDIFDIEVF